jgi:ferritin-like metal-binding protein YciE
MFGNVKTLPELFEIELRYAYDAEKTLVEKGIPSMIEAASSPELRSALQAHLGETQTHVTRLERVFGALGVKPETKSNEILDKLAAAAEDSTSNIEESSLRDAALIANGNMIEHYEIALYGTLVSFAKALALQEAVGPLQETLEEEKKADAKLSQLAAGVTNTRAARQSA